MLIRARRRVLSAVALAALLAFAAFVWPTAYRPIAILAPREDVVTGGLLAARQNRFTGRVEWLLPIAGRFIPSVIATGSRDPLDSASDEAGRELARIAEMARSETKTRRLFEESAIALAATLLALLTWVLRRRRAVRRP